MLSLSLILRLTASRPVCLGIKHPSGGLRTHFYYCHIISCVDMGRSLWREDWSVVCNCCWSSPAHQFSVLVLWESRPYFTSFFVASFDSQVYGGGIRPRIHTECLLVLFCKPRYIVSARKQFYRCIRKTTQRTSHVISSQRLHWCAVA
jgi:hypothetical protein